MCGVIGVMANSPVNQLIYDALLLLNTVDKTQLA